MNAVTEPWRRERMRRKQTLRVYVDGQAMTFAAIGARLGITADAAWKRYRKAERNGLVTWARLGA